MSDGRKNSGRHIGGYTVSRCDRSPSGEIIENARMDKNLSLVQAGELTRLSPGTISNMERYGVIPTKVGTLLAVCKAFDLDPMELIKADVGQIL